MVVKKEENPFGKRLQYYRNCTRKPNGRPLSQSDLADEMSKLPDTIITRDQIYKWESGKSRFSPKSRADLKKIVKILVSYKGIETISQANELFAFAGLRNPEENEIQYIGLPDISAQLIQQVLPLSEETPLSPLPTENEPPHPKIKVTATPIRAGSGGHLPFDPINNTVVDVFYNRTPSFKGMQMQFTRIALAMKLIFLLLPRGKGWLRTGLRSLSAASKTFRMSKNISFCVNRSWRLIRKL